LLNLSEIYILSTELRVEKSKHKPTKRRKKPEKLKNNIGDKKEFLI